METCVKCLEAGDRPGGREIARALKASGALSKGTWRNPYVPLDMDVPWARKPCPACPNRTLIEAKLMAGSLL